MSIIKINLELAVNQLDSQWTLELVTVRKKFVESSSVHWVTNITIFSCYIKNALSGIKRL